MKARIPYSPAVHTILKDVLPASIYYRFNPPLHEAIRIDECSPDQINRLVQLTEEYLEAGQGAGLEGECTRRMHDWYTSGVME